MGSSAGASATMAGKWRHIGRRRPRLLRSVRVQTADLRTLAHGSLEVAEVDSLRTDLGDDWIRAAPEKGVVGCVTGTG